MRAMIVDECAVARSAIEILLQRIGWEAIGAADGAEALRLAASWNFDLVITEREPTKVPGLQMLRILKAGLLPSDVRVLLNVEHPEEAGEARFMVDDLLIKNGQVEKQLQSKLVELFGNVAWTANQISSARKISRRKTKGSACKQNPRRAAAIDLAIGRDL